MKCVFVLTFLFWVGSFNLSAQDNEEELKLIEKYIENSEQTIDYLELVDQISQGTYKPVNLNKASAQQLLNLRLLTPYQVKAIINHRINYGDFISLLELQTIHELDSINLKQLSNWFYINENDLLTNRLTHQLRHSNKNVLLNYSQSSPLSQGFYRRSLDSNLIFQGNKFKHQLRFGAKYKNSLSIGVSAESDAGEEFFKGSNKFGYDFYSFHFYAKRKGLIKTIALGDFQAGFGQGLCFSSGFGIGKSAAVLNIKHPENNIRPYRSMNENNFLRGVGLNYVYKRFEFTTLISSLKLDVNLEYDSFSSTIKSFYTDGYHRTDSEIAKEKQARKSLIVQNISFNSNKITLGITAFTNRFSHTIRPNNELYNQYYFRGKQFSRLGLNFDYYFKNINCFSEVVSSSGGGYGVILGSIISLGKFLDVSYLHRFYSPKFIAINTTAFAESSNPVNEIGTYIGINLKINRRLKFSAYGDNYQQKWYSYYVDGLGRGIDFMSELNYNVNKSALIYVRFRRKAELTNYNNFNYNQLVTQNKSNLRIHIEQKVGTDFTIRNRLELSEFKNKDMQSYTGFLIFTDLVYKRRWFPFSAVVRLLFFNIEDYDARLFAAENDVQYTYPVIMYNNSGYRYFFLLKYKFNALSLQARYSYIHYYDRNNIGTGNNLVNANKLNELNVTISYGFN